MSHVDTHSERSTTKLHFVPHNVMQRVSSSGRMPTTAHAYGAAPFFHLLAPHHLPLGCVQITDVYVIKRPWVDKFMEAMGELYEVVVFTASLAKYADPLLDLLDPQKLVRIRLFRDSCCPYEGNYVKDLSRLGRKLEDTIIVDNSPHSYIFQPENAIPIGTFIGDPQDHELLDMIPLLADTRMSEDVRDMLLRQFPERSTSTSFW